MSSLKNTCQLCKIVCWISIIITNLMWQILIGYSFDNHACTISVDNKEYSLTLWWENCDEKSDGRANWTDSLNIVFRDTAGQEDYERLRPLSYPNVSQTINKAVNELKLFESYFLDWLFPVMLLNCVKDFVRERYNEMESWNKTLFTTCSNRVSRWVLGSVNTCAEQNSFSFLSKMSSCWAIVDSQRIPNPNRPTRGV